MNLLFAYVNVHIYYIIRGPGSVVGIATDYGLDGPGIESRWGRDFPLVQTGPGAHPASCTMGTGSFPGVKCGRGVLLTTQPLGRVELYLYPPLGHNRTCKGVALPLPFYINIITIKADNLIIIMVYINNKILLCSITFTSILLAQRTANSRLFLPLAIWHQISISKQRHVLVRLFAA